MSVVGEVAEFYTRHKFILEIEGFSDKQVEYTSCSDLSQQVAVIERWQGGRIIPVKQGGRVTIPDITLERGRTKNKDAHLWMREVANVASNGGLVPASYRRQLDIVQLAEDNSELERHTVFNAWPREYVAGSWDNTVDETVTERLILACDFWITTPET